MEIETRRRFVEIDSLRGLAALMVAIFHFDIYNSLTSNNIVLHSWLFVDFFFVLSGFIISYNYKNRLLGKDKFKRFIILRAGRLFPLHLSILLLFFLLEVAFFNFKKIGLLESYDAFSGGKVIVGLFYELGLMHALPFSIDTSWNSPSWSISVEFYVYIIFAFFIIFLKGRVGIFTKLCLLSLSFYVIYKSEVGIESSHEYALVRCIYGFFIGVFVEKVYMLLSKNKVIVSYLIATIVELIFLLGGLIYLYLASAKNIQLFAPIVFALFIVPFLFGLGGVSRFFRMRFFQFLGELSYSIYMVHAFVFLVINFLFKYLLSSYHERQGNLYIINYFDSNHFNILVGDIALLIALFVVLIFSVIVYNLIEKPGRSYARVIVGKYYPQSSEKKK